MRIGGHRRRTAGWVACVVGGVLTIASVVGAAETAPAGTGQRQYTLLDTVTESLLGDAYAPGRWSALDFGDFFSTGWDEPWIGAPNGADGEGAPRQGWLNAADGVFYRLFIVTFGWANQFGDKPGSGYTSGVTLYAPFNRRFEVRLDVPFVVSNRGLEPHQDYRISGGDFQVTPRFLLSQQANSEQSFDVTFRVPTGDVYNGNELAAITPFYNFWTNCWRGLVVRGGTGFNLPYGHTSVEELGARPAFIANLAAGYYFTPHDLTPIGDMVWYVATNFSQLIAGRGPATSTVTFTPGFRTHLGREWYLLGGVEVPATDPQPFNYQVLGGLMKVF